MADHEGAGSGGHGADHGWVTAHSATQTARPRHDLRQGFVGDRLRFGFTGLGKGIRVAGGFAVFWWQLPDRSPTGVRNEKPREVAPARF